LGGAYTAALAVAATRHDGDNFYQDYNLVAYVALCTVLQAMYAKDDKGKYLTALALAIGGKLENDQQLYVFTQDNKNFVGKIQDSLRHQNVTSYSHKLKTFQKKYRDAEMGWTEWGKVKRTHVGMKLIRAILTTMDDCFAVTKKHNGRHMAYYVDTTVEFDDWIIDQTEIRALCSPINKPLIEPPVPYERIDGEVVGGYHSAAMRKLAPFIKTRGDDHKEFVNSHFPFKHMTAVNNLQTTKWQANQEVVAVVRDYIRLGLLDENLPRMEKLDLPPHPGDDAEDERILQWKIDAKRVHGLNKANAISLMQLRNNLDFMHEIEDKPFWFTYSCDFRGRLYCNSPLVSVQGEDHLKAMIHFGDGKPMGESGLRWLAINGANKYGYDKVSFSERRAWILSIESTLKELVTNPTSSSSVSFLRGADKPFQFISFAYEWAKTGYGKDPTTIGYLPIGLDGSCNGLQHFAALLRDEVGGRATNLISSELPSDIYADVAAELHKLTLGRIGQDTCGAVLRTVGTLLLASAPDRKLTKRPVMTLPYGATQQSCRSYVREYIGDNAAKFGLHPDDDSGQWEYAVALAPLVWEAIKAVVVGARAGMDWLQRCASLASARGIYLRWISPANFPVYQHYSEYDAVVIKTELFGRMQVQIAGAELGISKYRARNGVAPNFVHALDSSHMVLTINDSFDRGITAMACIHDDYGTHAADTDTLYNSVRHTFAGMYAGHDWLAAWRMEILRLDDGLELPPPPAMGTLDPLLVLDSEFFFA
jgi:DNA-directed RNA polymerase